MPKASPMEPRFRRTVEIVEQILAPVAEALRAAPSPPFEEYAPLSAELMWETVERYRDIASAMAAPNRKVALFEFGLLPQLFYAFDCAPLCLEFYPPLFAKTSPDTVYSFLEAAESEGVPPEVCSTDRFIIGAAVKGELPGNAFLVTSSSPCDGTRATYPVLQGFLECPVLYLDAPFRYDQEAVRYYARQLRDDLIPFLEQVTGRPFDIERLRMAVEESNRAYECLVDIHDTHKVRPAPHPGSLRTAPYTTYVAGAGHPGTTRVLARMRQDAVQRVRDGRTRGPFEERHRVFWTHVIPAFDLDLFNWMEERFGAMVVSNSLSSTAVLDPIDTTSLDSMLEGIAWQGLDMTMSIMRFDTEKLVQFTLNAYEDYGCDCMIVTQHVGCKSICGAQGVFRKVCQKKGIPVLFIELDYNDDRVLSREGLRSQLEAFFTTVME